MIHENIELTGSFTVSGSFVLPSHASSSAVYETGSMYHDTVDGVLKVYTGTQWVTVGEQEGPGVPLPSIEYLLVAGGGSGGGGAAGSGGAGGAGGYLSSSLGSVTSGSSFTVTVGGGAANGGIAATGYQGSNSSIAGATISTITATGGGRGGYTNADAAGDGGSGGGGSSNNGSFGSGGSGTVGQGNDGGDGASLTTLQWAAAGGGGAGAAGETAEGNNNAGEGGAGLTSKITGTSIERAGGGGGGAWNAGYYGTATGGGGNGGAGSGDQGIAGTSNTGGGGGGGGQDGAGGAGGSGVAIFAYESGSFNCAGGIVGDAGNGRKYNQFNSSGNFKVGSTSDFGIVTDSLGLHIDAGNFSSRGTSTVTDLSGNGNNMSVTGASLGNNYYYSISGTSTYLTCPSAASIKSTTSLTVEAWFRLTDLTNQWKPIISKGSSDATEEYLLMARPGNNVIYFDCGGGSFYAQPSYTWSSNIWYHIVATHSRTGGTSTLDISVNNSDLSVTTNGGTETPGNTSDALYIGTARNNAIGGTGIQIAQARIYTKVLSASEINQNYNATKTNFV